ncbi:hypothetical protein H2509_19320 [Stappia sp. F7233]|uniref:Lipoprotein n=1 Tax=Stappia albiluteola TaxID=2758565 RepID=A0A839AJN5_9HYPH|nr:hypothetical protein [Stappia albiluteola]MBA5779286.1 hypothetical protein [Stappia albiluteola]
MRRLAVLAALALPLAACQSSGRSVSQYPQQAALTVPAGAQSVRVAASPDAVRQTLVSGASERGTPIIQNDANMVVLERLVTGENPALDSEFGPSDNGQRKFRIRVRFQGTPCDTLVVQEVFVVNNAGTALEQVFSVTQPQYNNPESLIGLKNKAEVLSGCA